MKSNDTKRTRPTFTRPYTLSPSKDGVEYINIYSNGRTELGLALSPFAMYEIVHPIYGWFACIEAFYYWLKTGKRYDNLRHLTGFRAKQEGKRYAKVECENFKEEIAYANRLKVEQNPRIAELLKENHLPFEHYYCYGFDENAKIYDMTAQYIHVIDELNLITAELQA